MRKALLFAASLYSGVAFAQSPPALSGAWSVQGDQTATNNPAARFDPLPHRISDQWVISGSGDRIRMCRRQLAGEQGLAVNPREAPCEPMEIRNVRYNGRELAFVVDSQLEGGMYTEITTQYYVRFESASRASGMAREIWDMAGNSLLPARKIVTDYRLALTKMREAQSPLDKPMPTPSSPPSSDAEDDDEPRTVRHHPADGDWQRGRPILTRRRRS